MCYGSFSDSELVRPHLCHFLIAHLIRQQMSAFYPFKGGYQRFFTGHFWPTNVHCRFLLYYKRTFFHIFWEEITNFCMVKARDWVWQIGPCALLFSKLQFKDLIDRQQFVVEACQRGGGWQICSDATSPQLAHTLLLFKNTLWKSTLLKKYRIFDQESFARKKFATWKVFFASASTMMVKIVNVTMIVTVYLLLPKTQLTKTFPFSDNAESINWAISIKCLTMMKKLLINIYLIYINIYQAFATNQ